MRSFYTVIAWFVTLGVVGIIYGASALAEGPRNSFGSDWAKSSRSTFEDVAVECEQHAHCPEDDRRCTLNLCEQGTCVIRTIEGCTEE